MRKLLLLGLALPAQVGAQEQAARVMLEAGLVGGSGDACPGRYVGIKERVAGPASLYGMVETYRCTDLRAPPTAVGVSLMFRRRYGARFIFHGRVRFVLSPPRRARRRLASAHGRNQPRNAGSMAFPHGTDGREYPCQADALFSRSELAHRVLYDASASMLLLGRRDHP